MSGATKVNSQFHSKIAPKGHRDTSEAKLRNCQRDLAFFFLVFSCSNYLVIFHPPAWIFFSAKKNVMFNQINAYYVL